MVKINLVLSNTLGTSLDGRRMGTEKKGIVPKIDFDPAKTIGISGAGRKVGSEKKGPVPKEPVS